jgi:hypothetical protein
LIEQSRKGAELTMAAISVAEGKMKAQTGQMDMLKKNVNEQTIRAEKLELLSQRQVSDLKTLRDETEKVKKTMEQRENSHQLENKIFVAQLAAKTNELGAQVILNANLNDLVNNLKSEGAQLKSMKENSEKFRIALEQSPDTSEQLKKATELNRQ